LHETNIKVIHTVQEKHKEFKQQVTKTLNALVANKDEQKVHQANILRTKALALMSILADQDVPNWLRAIESEAYLYYSSHKNSATFLIHLIRHNTEMMEYQWDFGQKYSVIYDVDEIYSQVKDKLKIDESFDDLTEKLATIIESGDIDGVGALESLKQLQSMVLQNKDSSYLGLTAVVRFGKNYFAHHNWEVVKNSLSEGNQAVQTENSFNNLDSKEQDVLIQIRAEVASRFDGGIKSVTNNNQYMIEDNSETGTVNIIDVEIND